MTKVLIALVGALLVAGCTTTSGHHGTNYRSEIAAGLSPSDQAELTDLSVKVLGTGGEDFRGSRLTKSMAQGPDGRTDCWVVQRVGTWQQWKCPD